MKTETMIFECSMLGLTQCVFCKTIACLSTYLLNFLPKTGVLRRRGNFLSFILEIFLLKERNVYLMCMPYFNEQRKITSEGNANLLLSPSTKHAHTHTLTLGLSLGCPQIILVQ